LFALLNKDPLKKFELLPLSAQFFSLVVIDLEFQEMKGFDRLDPDLASQFPAPSALLRVEPSRQIRGHKGMQGHIKPGRLVFVDQQRKLILHHLREKDGWLNLPASGTGGTILGGIDMHLRSYTLAGDLHQAEFAEG
jgi:hypothetical protein